MRIGLTMIGKGNSTDKRTEGPPAGDEARVEDVTDVPSAQPLIGRRDSVPGCLASRKAQTGGTSLTALRDQLKKDLATKGGEAIPEENADGHPMSEGADPKDGATPHKKPAASKRKAHKRPASAVPPSESKRFALPPDAPAVDVLRAKRSVMQFDFALSQLRKKKKKPDRPKMKAKAEATHYMGGHIYPRHQGKPVLRVFARKGDRHEHRIPYDDKDKKDKEDKWHLACSIVETDPREVIE